MSGSERFGYSLPFIGAGFVLALIIFSSIASVWFFYWLDHDFNKGDTHKGGTLQPDCSIYEPNPLTVTRQYPDVVAKNWPAYGRDFAGTRYNPHVDKFSIDDDDEGEFILCDLTTTSGVSATIVYDDTGIAYFPDWGIKDGVGTISDAKIYAKDTVTCNDEWVVYMKDIAVDPHTVVRTSVTLFTDSVGTDAVFFCDLGTPNLTCSNANSTLNDAACGAYCYALRRDDGTLMWRTRVSTQGEAIVTSSPTIVGQMAYFGLSSREAALLAEDSFTTESFIGESYVMNLNDGELVFVQPSIFGTVDTGNLTGGSVWGSPIPYDLHTDTAVFGTGNLYTLNDNLTTCLNDPAEDAWSCLPDGVWPDSLYAVRGTLWGHREVRAMDEKWVFNAQGVDAWNLACLEDPKGANCPDPEGPDYDFGSGAIIVTNECHEKFVIALQKSGAMWCKSLDTGATRWKTYLGPGNTLQNSWGLAYDGDRVYTAFGNVEGKYYRTLDGTVRCDGFWAALNPWTGEIEWLTPVPNSRQSSVCGTGSADPTMARWFTSSELLFANRGTLNPSAPAVSADPNPEPDATRDTSAYAHATGAVTVANGVLYGTAWNGYTYKIDARTGEIKDALKRFDSGSIYGGVSVSRYWDGTQWVDQLAVGGGYSEVAGPLPGSQVLFYNNK